jgi:hypothetical protein
MYLGRQSDELFYLTTPSGVPVTGLLYTDIVGNIWKQGMGVWSPITILAADWLELGGGYYVLKVAGSLLSPLGSVAIKLSGLSIAINVKESWIEPLPPTFAIAANQCAIFGNIMDLTGDSIYKDYLISFHLVSVPQKVGNVGLVSSDKVFARPDAFGNFSIVLLRGTTVLVEIERAGVRNQIIVPCDVASANLIDLLPPIQSLCP